MALCPPFPDQFPICGDKAQSLAGSQVAVSFRRWFVACAGIRSQQFAFLALLGTPTGYRSELQMINSNLIIVLSIRSPFFFPLPSPSDQCPFHPITLLLGPLPLLLISVLSSSSFSPPVWHRHIGMNTRTRAQPATRDKTIGNRAATVPDAADPGPCSYHRSRSCGAHPRTLGGSTTPGTGYHGRRRWPSRVPSRPQTT